MEKKTISPGRKKNSEVPKGKGPGTGRVRTPEKASLVVGVGASAGGLEAFSKLLKALPKKTGLAIVLVQHLDPKQRSQLPSILSRVASVPVSEIKDGMTLKPNHVHVVPSNATLEIEGETLRLLPRAKGDEAHLPIDHFFCSLAAARQDKAIAVVLSGTASDGAAGVQTIKAGGGITFAQEEASAGYPGMPRSAVATGCVDLVLPPARIASELARIARDPRMKLTRERKDLAVTENGDALKKILTALRKTTGVDFGEYRKSTIHRRIHRRMVLRKMDGLDAYAEFLKTNPAEVTDLYQDVLIHVTGFFRDPESFRVLEGRVFPKLAAKRKAPGESIRVWLPGCSTGEEAYSIAISLTEFLGEKAEKTRVQIFATDVSDRVIEMARRGIYTEDIMEEVSPERLRRFFTRRERGWQINKSIREMCVFAKQNVIKDPPFSKIDLISCRNLLIYLEPGLQQRLMPLFYYALNPDGFLLLGSAETIGNFGEAFHIVDQKTKLYQKNPGQSRPVAFGNVKNFGGDGAPEPEEPLHETSPEKPVTVWTRLDLLKEAERVIMSKYCPPSITVDENMEIIQFRGAVSPFIDPASGEASLSLYKMTRENFQMEIRAAIQRAKHGGVPIRKEAVEFKSDGKVKNVNIEVIPIGDPSQKQRCFVILFEETHLPLPPRSRDGATGGDKSLIRRMEQELVETKEHLQAVVEEQEATNEELRSANEEIQSSNEELQSTNEELETAKEELQSTNEELMTVNEELRHANVELAGANDDLGNLLRGVNLPIVMLDRGLRVRRFTPSARKTLKLLPSDIGRVITDLKPDLNIADLERLLRDVIDHLVIKEQEVQDKAGHWYLLQMRPYETSENKIAGVVMVLFDIDAAKASRAQAGLAAEYAEAVVQTVREPLVILGSALRVKTATEGFYKMFRVKPAATVGKLFFELGGGQWNIPKLRKLIEEVLPKNARVRDHEVKHDFPGLGFRRILINARRVSAAGSDTRLVLLSIKEVPER